VVVRLPEYWHRLRVWVCPRNNAARYTIQSEGSNGLNDGSRSYRLGALPPTFQLRFQCILDSYVLPHNNQPNHEGLSVTPEAAGEATKRPLPERPWDRGASPRRCPSDPWGHSSAIVRFVTRTIPHRLVVHRPQLFETGEPIAVMFLFTLEGFDSSHAREEAIDCHRGSARQLKPQWAPPDVYRSDPDTHRHPKQS
jgi:hypothetical protein